MKSALVVRYGAYGDAVMITPLLRVLKEDGYRVIMNASKRAKEILRHDPHIDEFLDHDESIPIKKLPEHWKKLKSEYDVFINLSGTIESTLLVEEGTPEFDWPYERRQKECNINYYDFTLAAGGYRYIRGKNAELYFTKKEHKEAQKIRKKYKYLILWTLSGSSFHKAYPYAEYVATEFLERYPEAAIITVGDYVCQILEWQHPRTINKSGKMSIRQTMLLTKYVDMVVGVETGVMVAAGCYDTPKIIMLSHASKENLTKYWKNTYEMIPDVPCHPCHQLHYTRQSCPLDDSGDPLCVNIKPRLVLEQMEEIYRRQKWQPLPSQHLIAS